MQKKIGNFPTVEKLQNWLKSLPIELEAWNIRQSKSVEHLFAEISNGECYLQIQPPLRVVSVVQVLVTNGELYLLELEQELDDKRKRKRNIPPSEKMKADENCLDAARRCLIEELGVNHDDIVIKSKDCKASTRYRKSHSYPGLKTKYFIFRVHAHVKGLSNENFWTEEINHKDGVEIKRRFCWGWSNLKKIKFPD
jgi:hypothetical protein